MKRRPCQTGWAMRASPVRRWPTSWAMSATRTRRRRRPHKRWGCQSLCRVHWKLCRDVEYYYTCSSEKTCSHYHENPVYQASLTCFFFCGLAYRRPAETAGAPAAVQAGGWSKKRTHAWRRPAGISDSHPGGRTGAGDKTAQAGRTQNLRIAIFFVLVIPTFIPSDFFCTSCLQQLLICFGFRGLCTDVKAQIRKTQDKVKHLQTRINIRVFSQMEFVDKKNICWCDADIVDCNLLFIYFLIVETKMTTRQN